MLISIEIMLLAITFLILLSSLSFDDILGQTYAIYVIAIAAAECAIALGILVVYDFFGKKALFIDSTFCSLSRYESSFLLHSTLINALQAPKVRHYATLTDLPPNQVNPFDIIDIYLTLDELRYTEHIISALFEVLIYDQHYSGVIGVLNRNNRSVDYIWREFYLHCYYSQLETFHSVILDTIKIADKNLLEVEVVLYLWPCCPGGVPYPNGPSVNYVIATHLSTYKGSFG